MRRYGKTRNRIRDQQRRGSKHDHELHRNFAGASVRLEIRSSKVSGDCRATVAALEPYAKAEGVMRGIAN